MLEHGNRIQITDETRCNIISRYEQQSAREIAKRYPFSRRVVMRVLKEAGVRLRKGNERGRRDTKKHPAWRGAKEITCLYQKREFSVYRIAKRYNCSAFTIIKILKENGIQRRGRHGARRSK